MRVSARLFVLSDWERSQKQLGIQSSAEQSQLSDVAVQLKRQYQSIHKKHDTSVDKQPACDVVYLNNKELLLLHHLFCQIRACVVKCMFHVTNSCKNGVGQLKSKKEEKNKSRS